MPNFWAHRICAGIALERLEGTNAADIIKSNAASFRLGSQGADMMYFRPTQLLRGRKGVVYHAKLIHSQPVAKLAELSGRYLKSAAGKRQFASTFAYVCGFLCHHSVDQMVHPFIDERTSSVLKHRRIELDFDAYMSKALDIRPDRDHHHWTGMSGFVGFAGLAQYYNYLFHGLFSKKFKLRSYIKDFKAMRRMSGLLDKPRRLDKARHTERPVLSEQELNDMLSAAIQGSWNAAAMIEDLYQEVKALIPVEQSLIPTAIPQSIEI